jgi:hypothetical protein
MGRGELLMTTQTTNYNLVKPGYEDDADIAVINNNMDLIDTALFNKVEKAAGKDLSTNDYTTEEKNKLAGIEANANNYVHPEGTNPHSTTKSDVGLGNVDNTKQMPISGGKLENYTEKLVALTSTEGASTIDLSAGNVFSHTLTEATTYSISNAVSNAAHSFTLIITQPATSVAVTFPASVKWQNGATPDMNAASKIYVVTFLSIDGGTTWLGMFGGAF